MSDKPYDCNTGFDASSVQRTAAEQNAGAGNPVGFPPRFSDVNGKTILSERVLMDGGMAFEDAEKAMKRLRDAEDGLRDQFAMNAPPVPEWFMRLSYGNTTTVGYNMYVDTVTTRSDKEEQSRFFAWRWHYADEMMKGRR